MTNRVILQPQRLAKQFDTLLYQIRLNALVMYVYKHQICDLLLLPERFVVVELAGHINKG
jgi:hypothetical protein